MSAKKGKNLKKERSGDASTLKKYRVPNAVVNYYLVLMFTVFPLFYTNSYSNIRHDKYYLFLGLSAALVIVGFFAALLNYFNGSGESPPCEKWYKSLSVTDFALGAFIVVSVISTIFSSYSFSCISGEQGRNVGLIFLIAAALVYAVISRFYIPKDYVFFFIAGGSLAVYFLAVLNYFYIDPLSMFKGYGEDVIKDFISTIGNKNIMSAFCCLTIPLFVTLYLNTKNAYLKYLSLLSSAVGFSAMLCSDSESGFLGLTVIFALILLYYSRKAVMIRKLFTALGVMIIGAKVIGIFSFFAKDSEKSIGSLQKFFINNNLSFVLIAVCVIFAAVMYITERKIGDRLLPKAVSYILSAVYLLAVLGGISALVYFTVFDTETKLGGLTAYLRFGEKWGTHRGYMWIKSWEIFKSGGIKNALLGNGPDSFFYAFSPYFNELSERFGDSSTNCAHNEFLNYLITTGVLGLSAYLTFTASAVVRAVKSAEKNYLAVVFAAPALCYLVQSAVNISNPIVTPFLFIYLGLAEAVIRSVKNL